MTILCYHDVHDTWDSPLAIPRQVFAEHCAWLARARRVVGLEDALGRLNRRGLLPRGMASLTFDDGFAELFDIAWPIWRQYGLSCTVFLVAGTLADPARPVDWVDTPPVWPLRTLTAEQVLEMRADGVRFASHSWSHHDLTTLGEVECERDLRDSRELLEDLLRERVTYLAYPRGRHAPHVRRAAERAGYEASFALPQFRERPGPHSVPRVGLFRGNGVGALRVKCAPGYLRMRTHPQVVALRSRG